MDGIVISNSKGHISHKPTLYITRAHANNKILKKRLILEG